MFPNRAQLVGNSCHFSLRSSFQSYQTYNIHTPSHVQETSILLSFIYFQAYSVTCFWFKIFLDSCCSRISTFTASLDYLRPSRIMFVAHPERCKSSTKTAWKLQFRIIGYQPGCHHTFGTLKPINQEKNISCSDSQTGSVCGTIKFLTINSDYPDLLCISVNIKLSYIRSMWFPIGCNNSYIYKSIFWL